MIFVTLSHYPDLFQGLVECLDKYEPLLPRILVRDGELIQTVPPNWRVVDAPTPFIYARNVNLAWAEAGEQDVILCGDDVRFSGPFVRALRDKAYEDTAYGISCAQLWGQSPFVCGYFKRDVIKAVGEMDERFTGYGREDNDFCRRMEALGYSTQPVEIPATHNGGTSFWKRASEGGFNMQAESDRNQRLYEEKWK